MSARPHHEIVSPFTSVTPPNPTNLEEDSIYTPRVRVTTTSTRDYTRLAIRPFETFAERFLATRRVLDYIRIADNLANLRAEQERRINRHIIPGTVHLETFGILMHYHRLTEGDNDTDINNYLRALGGLVAPIEGAPRLTGWNGVHPDDNTQHIWCLNSPDGQPISQTLPKSVADEMRQNPLAALAPLSK